MAKPVYKSLACLADVRRLLVLSVGGVAVGLTPRSWEPAAVGVLMNAYEVVLADKLRQLAATMSCVLPPDETWDPEQIARDYVRMRIEDMWGRVAGMRRFGWRPQVEVCGLEHLREALGRGRGAILWCMRFSSATALKQGLFQAGVPLVHLSRVMHGSPSETRLGVRVVGPMYCRAENPYLAERIRIPMDGSLGYLKGLRRRLTENTCVSIFGEHSGRANVTTEVLGVRREFAIGAPSLAWSEGAALLLAYPLRTGSFRYRIVIEPEMRVDRSIDRKTYASQAVRQFAKRLEELILEHPADWQGWIFKSLNQRLDRPKE